ncbi:MAG: hypothetical protein Q7R39_12565, partial [Dehalococcoidia bacterium]|nr:hypothetical protein [Dehalococcoidia bacterium]
VETVELTLPLQFGGLSGPEGQQALAGVAFGLVPESPVGALLAVDLFQAETSPADGQPVPVCLLDLSQPNCCVMDVWSDVVEVDVQSDSVFQFIPLLSRCSHRQGRSAL